MISIDVDQLAAAIADRLDKPACWLDVSAAASYMSVTENWVRARLGRIPYHKIDKKILLRRDDLDAFANQYRKETT